MLSIGGGGSDLRTEEFFTKQRCGNVDSGRLVESKASLAKENAAEALGHFQEGQRPTLWFRKILSQNFIGLLDKLLP